MNKKKKKTVIELETYAIFNNKSIKLTDLLKELLTENEDYKTRIDKAIEYLEHEQFKRTILGLGRDKYLDAIKNKTIEILKGEENDNAI